VSLELSLIKKNLGLNAFGSNQSCLRATFGFTGHFPSYSFFCQSLIKVLIKKLSWNVKCHKGRKGANVSQKVSQKVSQIIWMAPMRILINVKMLIRQSLHGQFQGLILGWKEFDPLFLKLAIFKLKLFHLISEAVIKASSTKLS